MREILHLAIQEANFEKKCFMGWVNYKGTIMYQVMQQCMFFTYHARLNSLFLVSWKCAFFIHLENDYSSCSSYLHAVDASTYVLGSGRPNDWIRVSQENCSIEEEEEASVCLAASAFEEVLSFPNHLLFLLLLLRRRFSDYTIYCTNLFVCLGHVSKALKLYHILV